MEREVVFSWTFFVFCYFHVIRHKLLGMWHAKSYKKNKQTEHTQEAYLECAQKINRAINEIANGAAPLGRRNAAIGGAQETIREAEGHVRII
jgi:hypothetical protein